MANQLESAINIKEAIDWIDSGELLLPSIQRRFVWNPTQIEFLFDSMMQNYPINSFMFWQVSEDSIKNQFRFYDFLKKYVEYKGGNNEERNTKGYKNFKAVIDGQQRLNSLYIGLKGSYAYKNYVYRKKKYAHDEKNYPSRYLYLDILTPLENDEEKKVYDFRFLVHNEFRKDNESNTKIIQNADGNNEEVSCFWFKVGKILEFRDEHEVLTFLMENNIETRGFSGKTLLKLYKIINDLPIVNYYLEKEQNFDKVLYEFIRTNSGGTKLSFADLLMSIITASWEKGKSTKGAREELDDLIHQVWNIGFGINQDFVLKTCLVLFSSDIRFRLKNFDKETVSKIKQEWGTITSCIKSCFELVRSLKFNNHSLRAKNSVIPIIYYLYISKKFNTINKENLHKTDKALIKKFLHISLLNKLFGGSSDGFLKKLKGVLTNNSSTNFPFIQIKEKFKGANRSFNMDNEKIEAILRTHYGNLDSFYILSLLFPTFNFEFKNPNIDHLHPRSQFEEEKLIFLKTEEEKEFYNSYWNTILNLSLLSEEQNKSKNKAPLKDWVEKEIKTNGKIKNDLLIPESVDLDIAKFESFITAREVLLKEIIKKNIE